MSRILGLNLLLLFLTAATCAADSPQDFDYKLTLSGQTEMERDGKKHKIGNDTVVRYTRRRDGKDGHSIQVICQSLAVKHSIDGVVAEDGFMDREKTSLTGSDGRKLEQFAAQEPALKKQLEASFGTVLAKLELDDDGVELKRTVSTDPGAKDVLENGVVMHCLLFHAPYPKDKTMWTRPIEYNMPGGAEASGELKYEKSDDTSYEPSAKNLKTVKVSGSLIAPVVRDSGRRIVARKVKMEIQGEQTFDTELREWVSGAHTATINFPLNDGDRETTAKCVMTIKLERVTDAKPRN